MLNTFRIDYTHAGFIYISNYKIFSLAIQASNLWLKILNNMLLISVLLLKML